MLARSLEDRIIDIKSDLQQIKNTQAMQNDGYILYRYRTDNLFYTTPSGEGSRNYTLEFEPYDKSDTVICQFMMKSVSDPFSIKGLVSPDNQLKAYFYIPAYPSGSSGDMRVWVCSNKAGIIKLTQIS